ncbi:hypothetical protein NQZ68_027605 [Dissostichus eleginoides]|nr:hypothetical protein NQZ68_027605 [Dissostichus eleginoides]
MGPALCLRTDGWPSKVPRHLVQPFPPLSVMLPSRDLVVPNSLLDWPDASHPPRDRYINKLVLIHQLHPKHQQFDPCDPSDRRLLAVPPSAKVTCHQRLLHGPAMALTLPRGAVKVLTPSSLCTLALEKGLVTGRATCCLLVWDEMTVPKDPKCYHNHSIGMV